MKINVVTLCSGLGSQEMALKRLRRNYPHFDFDIIATSEIDANATTAYNACHPEFADRQVGDLTTYDWSNITEPIDLLFYSTPCQSVSRAGKRKGMKEGDDVASALIWHTRRVIETLKPRILILENVRGMIDKKNIKDFNDWQHTLEELGYTNFTQVLNSKDFGVAQSRERIFMVSILNCDKPFYFPKPFPLTKRLKDYLEDDVDEKYYLSDEQVKKIIAHCERKISEGCGFNYRFEGESGISGSDTAAYGTRETDTYLKEPRAIQVAQMYDQEQNPMAGRIFSPDGLCPTITTPTGGHTEPKIVSYSRDSKGQIVNNHIKDVVNTIHTCTGQGGNTDQYVLENFKIRKLTPIEVGRLMGCSDVDINKMINTGIGKSALYKLFGNSIVVDVLYHIFKSLFIDTEPKENQQLILF